MTLTYKTPRVRYTGDGTTKTFTVPFPYGEQSDLSVVLYHKDKSQSQAQIASSTGANNPNGGTVTLTSAPDAGVIVTVLRQVDYAQKLRLDVGGELPSKSLEQALDYTVMQTQQLAEFQGRTLRLMPHTDLTKPIWVEDPKDGVAPIYQRQSDGSYRLIPSSGSLESQLTESKGYVGTVQKLSQQVESDKRLIDGYKIATQTASTQAQKLLQDTQTKLSSFDTSNFANSTLSNVTNADFTTKAKSAGIGQQKLFTQIFTQTSGKFFVRDADGSLPTGIDTSKVWSLADQKTANGGIMPSGKTHIELPVGANRFYVAGAGGGGGSGSASSGDGSRGGNTTLSVSPQAIANGGGGGTQGHGSRGNRHAIEHAGGSGGSVIVGGGASGGNAGGDKNENGEDGGNGGLVIITKPLSNSDVIPFSIGSKGTGGSRSGRWGRGGNGVDGYIKVEYVS